VSFRFPLPQPSNEDDFELFCLRLLRELWNCHTLHQYGKRGERQDGIDLIDEAGGVSLRAVQCKHHEPDKTIPPKEIEDEVAKALNSGLGLSEYYILTSARKTTHSQKTVIKLNQDHAKKGQFKVILWTWVEIEQYLSALNDAAKDRVMYGDTGRSAPVLEMMLTTVLHSHFDNPHYHSASALDAELDAANALVEAHAVEAAAHALATLETRHGAKLSDAQWYRLKAMRATLLMNQGEWEKAGHLLLDARRHQPNLERAKVNEALGFELLGNQLKAHDLAIALRAEFPHSQRPVAIWIRTAPETVPFSELETVAASLPYDEETALALTHRGMVANLPEMTARYAEQVIQNAPNTPQGHFQLGLARHAQGSRTHGSEQVRLFAEAERAYDTATALCRERKLNELEAAALVNRGIVLSLRGDPRAESDFVAAADRAPRRDCRLNYVGFLLDRARFADALRELLRVTDRTGTEIQFLEAAVRHGRNQGNDRTVARELLVKLISAGPGERWLDAHLVLVQFVVDEKTPALAEPVIRSSALAVQDPLAFHSLLGWLAHERGDSADADRELVAATAAVGPDSPGKVLRLLTQVLTTRGNDESALPLLERVARPGVFDADGRRLLDCAIRLNRHNVVQRICRELRLAGVTDPRLIRTEIQVLQMYNSNEAFRVADEYLATQPEDKHVALWRSHLALRLERPELIVTDLSRLPAADEVDPQFGQLAIIALRARGQFGAALHYSYELLREHFDSEDAHGQYLWYFHILSSRLPELGTASPAIVGTAICYRESDGSLERWVVIEPGPDPDQGRDEYPPDHHLAQKFLGCKVGDTVVLSSGAVQDRTATVCGIVSRYVFRFQDCMSQFQVRFPNTSTCQVVRAVTNNVFDPTPFVKGLQDRRRHIERLDELYQTQPIPLHTYAAWGGSDAFSAWEYLAGSPRRGIHCFNGPRDEFVAALERVRARKTVVLDSTALHTLARLRLLRVLSSPHWIFVVSQNTYDHLRDRVDSAEREPRELGNLFLRGEDGLTFVERTPEEHEQHLAFLRSMPDAVRAHCQIRPCIGAASLVPTKRAQIDEVLGRHNLEAMMLGAEDSAVLWTDDQVVGLIARGDFGADRIWTQVMLCEMRQQGGLTEAELDRASAQLVGWRYNGTQMGEATLLAAAELANWDMKRWPVAQVMEWLGNADVSPVARLSLAAAAIKAVWRRDDAQNARQGFLFAILESIRSAGLIARLLGHVPVLFGLDFFSAEEVATYIRYWLRYPSVLVTR
jgi:tetratricopeptide (TPR) repeat protein